LAAKQTIEKPQPLPSLSNRTHIPAYNGEPSSEAKLRRLDEIYAGSGAVITNTARFNDWQRWGYVWGLDIEPTLLEIAARKGPEWSPKTLVFFDEPIRERYKARLSGSSVGSWRGPARDRSVADLSDDELMALIRSADPAAES
jgi:hypothetical protein